MPRLNAGGGNDASPVVVKLAEELFAAAPHTMPVSMELNIDALAGQPVYFVWGHDMQDALSAKLFIIDPQFRRQFAEQLVFLTARQAPCQCEILDVANGCIVARSIESAGEHPGPIEVPGSFP